jgi:uncharacterized membrane protein YagU involved in acid resistance
MAAVLKTRGDFSKITGPYPVLAIFLVVVEGFLGIWLSRAESMLERTIAGVLMVGLLAGFLAALLKMRQQETGQPKSKEIQLPDRPNETINPAGAEVTSQEIANPQPQFLVGPDRLYVINKPPESWDVRELTTRELVSAEWEITHPDFLDETAPSLPTENERENVLFRARRKLHVIPVPGRTLINGGKVLTALELTAHVQLVIQPVDRMSPPFMSERSFEDNFLNVVGHLLASLPISVRSLHLGTMPNSTRKRYTLEYRQDLKDAIADGREGQDVSLITILVGIEGDIRDHLLRIQYPSSPLMSDAGLEQDVQRLRSLVDSFRPLELLSAAPKQAKLKQLAEQQYHQLITNEGKGKDIFLYELRILILRMQEWNFEDPDTRLRAIKLLKPFETFARHIQYENEEFEKFWRALHKAEQGGDASEFKSYLRTLVELALNNGHSQAVQETEPTAERPGQEAPKVPVSGKVRRPVRLSKPTPPPKK